MKRLSALLLICIIMFSACTTTGGNVPAPVDRTTMLIEALATSPTGEVVEEEKETITPAKEIVKEPSSPVKTEETAEEKLPESVEETVINPPVEVSEPENEIIVQEAEQPADVEEVAELTVGISVVARPSCEQRRHLPPLRLHHGIEQHLLEHQVIVAVQPSAVRAVKPVVPYYAEHRLAVALYETCVAAAQHSRVVRAD